MSDDEWCPDHDGSHCYALRDLAERVSRLESGAVVSNERAILVDLIAELRDAHPAQYEQRSSVELVMRREMTMDAIDRAEARLRKVTDE